MLYADKELDQISDAISQFIKTFEERTGTKLSLEELKMLFIQEAEAKELLMFKSSFGTFTPKSLREAARYLEKTPNQQN